MSDEVREWVRQARAGDPAAYDGPSLEAVDALLKRVTELEAALREIIDVEDKTYWDDPSAGFAAIARAALEGQA